MLGCRWGCAADGVSAASQSNLGSDRLDPGYPPFHGHLHPGFTPGGNLPPRRRNYNMKGAYFDNGG